MPTDDAPLSLLLQRHRRRSWRASIVDVVVMAVIVFVSVTAVAIFFGFRPIIPAAVASMFAAAMAWRLPESIKDIAAGLDDRNHLADLLGSAWGVRHRLDEPWALQLWAMANARAATLPPPAWPGRFSVRQQTCGLAMAAAALLVTRLISPNVALAAKDRPSEAESVAIRRPEVQNIADVHPRAGDSAQSAAKGPGEFEAARQQDASAGGDRSRRTAGDDAKGSGQADSKRMTALPMPKSASVLTPTEAGVDADGSPAAATASSATASAGGVAATERSLEEESPALRRDSIKAPAVYHSPAAAPTPAAYRDLVRDFFAR